MSKADEKEPALKFGSAVASEKISFRRRQGTEKYNPLLAAVLELKPCKGEATDTWLPVQIPAEATADNFRNNVSAALNRLLEDAGKDDVALRFRVSGDGKSLFISRWPGDTRRAPRAAAPKTKGKK